MGQELGGSVLRTLDGTYVVSGPVLRTLDGTAFSKWFSIKNIRWNQCGIDPVLRTLDGTDVIAQVRTK